MYEIYRHKIFVYHLMIMMLLLVGGFTFKLWQQLEPDGPSTDTVELTSQGKCVTCMPLRH